MPNTLVHLGLQGGLNRAVFRNIDLRWVFAGCVIPDVPWIMQRIVSGTDIDPYSLRLYATIQASALFCLVLSGAIAAMAVKWRQAFLILAGNSLLHLLCDALEIKWGNGVNLLAPFSWDLVNFGVVWPESPLTGALTLAGLGYVVFVWRSLAQGAGPLALAPGRHWIAAALLIAIYGFAPLIFMPDAQRADVHFVDTLRDRASRPGKYLELDRSELRSTGDDTLVRTYAGELLRIQPRPEAPPGTVSVRGRFVAADTVSVEGIHVHHARLREFASVLGLALVAVMWTRALWISRRPLARRDELS